MKKSNHFTKFTPSEANVARRLALTNILLSVKPGDIISYAELSRQAGFSVRDYSSQLSYVKGRLIKDQRIVFGLIWGEGLIRLTSQGILLLAESKENSLRKRSVKNINILISIDRGDLNADEQKRYDILLKNSAFIYSSLRDDTAAERLAPFVHYPKNGPEVGMVLRELFGSARRKLKVVVPKTAA
jgi:hypothetical protein